VKNTYMVGTKTELEESSGTEYSSYSEAISAAREEGLFVMELTWEYIDSEYVSGFDPSEEDSEGDSDAI